MVEDLEKAFKNEKYGRQRIIYQAVWLLAKGWKRDKVSEAIGLSQDRIRQLVTKYHQGGILALCLKKQQGNNYLLTREQKKHIKELLRSQKYWSIYSLKQLIKREFNLTYKDQDSYRRLLIWCGFSFNKSEFLWSA